MTMTKKQKNLNKKIRHLQTKTYANKQAKKLRKQQLENWSKEIRNRANNQCEVCYGNKNLNAHHLLPKEKFPEYKLESMNGVCLCCKCHKFGKFSAHANSIWFSEWIKANKRPQYDWVIHCLEGA